MYQGKPIEAACVESCLDERPTKRVLLKDCPEPANILDCELRIRNKINGTL
jgi:hypothetical protein